MSGISTYFDQAQLALSAYANLWNGMSQVAYEAALRQDGSGMSQIQAERFAASWQVIDQFTDTSSGFSATLFEREGQCYLAIRGTQPTDILDLIADADLATANGVAAKQTIALYNYVQRLKGTRGQPVAQIEWNGSNYVLNPSGAVGLLDAPLSGAITVTGHSLGGHLAMAFGRLFP